MKISVEVKNGIPVTSSRTVAEVFEKQHKDVLRDINNLTTSAQNCADLDSWFIEGSEPDSYGRPSKVIYMTRDGFSLLAMPSSNWRGF